MALKKPWRWLVVVVFFGFFIYRRVVMVTAPESGYPDIDSLYPVSNEAFDKLVGIVSAISGTGALVALLIVLNRAVKKNTTFFINADTHYLFPGPFRPQSILLYQMVKSLLPALFSALVVLLYFFVFLTPEQLPFDTVKLFALALPVGLFFFSLRPIQFLIFSYVAGGQSQRAVRHIRWVRNLLLISALLAIAVKISDFRGVKELVRAVFVHGSFQFVPYVGWFQASVTSILEGQWFSLNLLLFAATSAALPAGVYVLGKNYYEDVLASTELQTRAEQMRSGESQLSDDVEYSWAINTRTIRHHKEFGRGGVALFWKNWVMSFRQSGLPVVDPTTLVMGVLGVLLGLLYGLGVVDADNLSEIATFSFILLMFISFFAGWMRVRIGDLARPIFALIPDTTARKFFFFILLDLLQIGLLTTVFYLPVWIAGGIDFYFVLGCMVASEVVYLTGFLYQLNVKLRVRNALDRYLLLPLAYFAMLTFCVAPSVLVVIAGSGYFNSLAAGIFCGALVWAAWSVLLYFFAEEEIAQLEF